MDFPKTDKEIFTDGIRLTVDKLIPSHVRVNEGVDEKYSANLYATMCDRYEGYLHFRIYDAASEEFDPALTYNGEKISEVTLKFSQTGDEDDCRFDFYNKDDVKIVLVNGVEKKIKTPSVLDGLNLIYAAKLFFIDILRILLNADNSKAL